tara:strand:+ start:3020 stop:3337 length:318 start_codon:yes stop_codon:yes gene_type:complete
MKKILIILTTMFSLGCYSQKYTLLEINAKWNQKNNLQQNKIAGIRINFGWLEDQPKKMQSKIRSVPILVLFKDGKPIYQWLAGIDFKLNVTEEEFEKVFNKLKNK